MAKWTFTSNVLNMPRMNNWTIVISPARKKEVNGELIIVPANQVQFRKGILSVDDQEVYDFLTKSRFGKANYRNTYMLLEDAAQLKAPPLRAHVQPTVGPPVAPVVLQQQAAPPQEDPLNRDQNRQAEAPIVRSKEDVKLLAQAQGGSAEAAAPAVVAEDFSKGGEVPVKKGAPKRESEISAGEEEEVSSASAAARAMAGEDPPTPAPGAPAESPAAPAPAMSEEPMTWPQLKAKGRELGIKVVGISKANLEAEIKLKLSKV